MANEAVMKVRIEDALDFKISGGSSIEKGTLMVISGAGSLAIPSHGRANPWAGVCAREVISGDGRDRAPLFRRGWARLKATDQNIPVGRWVTISGANTIATASEVELASGAGIGIAREAISGGNSGLVILGGY